MPAPQPLPSLLGGPSGSPRSPAAEAGPVEGRRSLQGLLSGIFEVHPGPNLAFGRLYFMAQCQTHVCC